MCTSDVHERVTNQVDQSGRAGHSGKLVLHPTPMIRTAPTGPDICQDNCVKLSIFFLVKIPLVFLKIGALCDYQTARVTRLGSSAVLLGLSEYRDDFLSLFTNS